MTMLPLGDVAPIRRRAIAYIIDAAIGGVVSVVIPTIVMVVIAATSGNIFTALLVAGPLFSLLGLAWLIVYTVMQAGRGSIGMRTQGIRLANASDGSALGFGRALLRNVIWGLAASIVVGYFTVLFDGSGRFQGWHDKVAGAVMLDARTAVRTAAPLDAAPLNAAPLNASPVVGAARANIAPSPESAMPGFAQPAPQTAMPGFAPPAPQTATSGFSSPPSAFAPPPAPDAVPVAAPAPQPPAEDENVEHTVLSPRIKRDLPDDPLISFVPGVTQEPIQRAVSPEPVAVQEADVEPAAPSAPLATAAAPAAPGTSEEQAVPAVAEERAAPFGRLGATASVPVLPDDEAEDIESTRISVPGHRLVFTWDDGQRATVSGRTVFGRNPEDGEGATNVSVRDETRSLSKTHFEAGATASGGWVMDRQSTNGTTVVREGVRIACPPGQRVPVRLGDALEIGDRIVTIGGFV